MVLFERFNVIESALPFFDHKSVAVITNKPPLLNKGPLLKLISRDKPSGTYSTIFGKLSATQHSELRLMVNLESVDQTYSYFFT